MLSLVFTIRRPGTWYMELVDDRGSSHVCVDVRIRGEGRYRLYASKCACGYTGPYRPTEELARDDVTAHKRLEPTVTSIWGWTPPLATMITPLRGPFP